MDPDKRNLYRMPWSINENPIGWLEITDICNIHCAGCYRLARYGHKPLDQIKEEVLFLKKWRNCSSISLVGGEAILHPDILELIRFINANKMKSIIITNGVGLTEKNLTEMKIAGLTGVSFHIDTTQERPEFRGQQIVNETMLDDIRLKYARLVAKVGGLTSGFGITADVNNFHEIPKFVRWAVNNFRIVNSISFITYRGIPVGEGYEYYALDKKIDLKADSLGNTIDLDKINTIRITSKDIYSIIKEHFPAYDVNSYLGGTIDHTSFKWLIGSIILNSRLKMFGTYGKKTMEIFQVVYHLVNGAYGLHLKKRNFGKKIFIMGLFDKVVRKTFKEFLKYVILNPIRLFYPVHILNIGIVQAPDILPDGTCDLCESCPDMCVYDGKLVNSCRLDEYMEYGALMHIHKTNGNIKTPGLA
jgi:MoaA/NifB/PqqE/SkfB family radical SAM enzyme